jgi:hypothetical protein
MSASSARAWPVLLLGMVGLVASARAQESSPVVVLHLMVSHASNRPGPIDPRAAELHRRLKNDFRYGGLSVLQQQLMQLRLQEIGTMELPTGKRLEIRPLHLTEGAVLISVQIDGVMSADLKVPNHHLVLLGGAQSYQDGKLIVSLEPDY